VSAFLQPSGIPGRIVEAWRAGQFEAALSAPLLEEVDEVLSRRRVRRLLHAMSSEVKTFLDLYSRVAFFVSGPLAIVPVIPDDPDDDAAPATALAAKADVVVSGNAHLLDLKEYEGIPILTPRQFLALLAEAQGL